MKALQRSLLTSLKVWHVDFVVFFNKMEKYGTLNEVDRTLAATVEQDIKAFPRESIPVYLIFVNSEVQAVYYMPLDTVQAFKIRFF